MRSVRLWCAKAFVNTDRTYWARCSIIQAMARPNQIRAKSMEFWDFLKMLNFISFLFYLPIWSIRLKRENQHSNERSKCALELEKNIDSNCMNCTVLITWTYCEWKICFQKKKKTEIVAVDEEKWRQQQQQVVRCGGASLNFKHMYANVIAATTNVYNHHQLNSRSRVLLNLYGILSVSSMVVFYWRGFLSEACARA